ncbi:MAG TPA: carboxypeptidase-like regulatory domain-containing protein [Vicinamibacterales bacterium]|jgi:hypothetical protein
MRYAVVALAIFAVGCDHSATPSRLPTSPSVAHATTFNLTGSVHDTLLRAVSGAQVEIVTAPLEAHSTTTDASGFFTFHDLTPVTDVVTLRVTKAGFVPATVVAGNNYKVVVALTEIAVSARQGEYRLTLTAADECGALPPAVRARTYKAALEIIHSPSPNATIALSGADFYSGYETFWGQIGVDSAQFHLSSWYAFSQWLEDHPIFERLDSTTYVSFSGVANAMLAASDTSITTALSGTVSYCAAARDSTTPNFPPSCDAVTVECTSGQHRLSLSRP